MQTGRQSGEEPAGRTCRRFSTPADPAMVELSSLSRFGCGGRRAAAHRSRDATFMGRLPSSEGLTVPDPQMMGRDGHLRTREAGWWAKLGRCKERPSKAVLNRVAQPARSILARVAGVGRREADPEARARPPVSCTLAVGRVTSISHKRKKVYFPPKLFLYFSTQMKS